jgi:hypothetical protein
MTGANLPQFNVAAYSSNLPTYSAGLTYGGLLASPLDRYTFLQNSVANKWLADGAVQKFAVDGLHLSDYAAHTYARAKMGATWVAQLAALTPVTITQVPADFTTSSPTYSGGYATGGTFTENDVFPSGGKFSVLLNVKIGASVSVNTQVMPNNQNGYVKYMQVNTTRTVTISNPSGTTYTTTGTLNANATNEIAVTNDGTNLYVSLNGTYDGSIASGATVATASKFQVAPVVGNGVSLNEVTIWNVALWTNGNHTPTTYTGSEANCVVRWPLSTNSTAVAGPALPI